MTFFESAALAKSILTALALTAVQGSVLALVALGLARAGKLRPSWQAAIWLVVLAKFVLPYGPAMPWSLADLIASFGADSASHAITLAPMTAGPAPAPPLAPAVGWLVLASLWGAGTAFVLARALIRHRHALREAHAAPLAPASARALLVELAVAIRVRTPRLAVGDAATGPYVIGALRPVIVVPPALLEDDALLRAALLHELAHIRRRDALARLVQVVATALFFFWPIVRLASRRLDLAREAACDAWALEQSGIARPAYARLLVRMAALRTTHGHALAMPRSINARVAAVLGPPARARLGAVHALALLVWAGLALGGARRSEAATATETCEYTPAIAEALRQAHPEADVDGDGVLTKDEACDFQASVSRMDEVARADLETVLSEPLCCKCDPGETTGTLDATCQSEGVNR